ncbi:TniQ family protein [Oerskovia sp. NPDC056781]|uniref:TniQ family protein n=1 Tax=Oerskovia sp. NPDC056781 TaxID=3345942 RepID=UPI00366C8137
MTALPVRVAPMQGQSLPDWLEHLAAINGMTAAQMETALREDGGSTRFLAVRPDPRTTRTITHLTGQPARTVLALTLARYDGTALDLTGLDTDRWSSWRSVAARGWFRPRGTAACPTCLATDGYWRLRWRLSTVTVCTTHNCYLREWCPGCGRRFDDHPHTLFRHHASTRCLNPTGPGTWCECDLASLPAASAGRDNIERQIRHDEALESGTLSVLGRLVSAATYLADERHLAVLLLHLATRAGGDVLPGWVESVRREAESTPRRRWHLAPPEEPQVRSAVLTTANEMLTAPDLTTGAALLAPWVKTAPTGRESRLGWLADRTTMTPDLTRLVTTALAPHQRNSFHLSRTTTRLTPERVPQAVPEPLYRAHAATLFSTTRGETNRLFLSLCLARQVGAVSWADAAQLLGISASRGSRTARAVSTRSRIDPQGLAAALQAISSDLMANYRAHERTVQGLAARRAWFEDWADEHRPGTRPTSHAYAVTWLWCHFASALPSTTPAYLTGMSRAAKSNYWQFTTSLTHVAATALNDIAHRNHQEQPDDERT